MPAGGLLAAGAIALTALPVLEGLPVEGFTCLGRGVLPRPLILPTVLASMSVTLISWLLLLNVLESSIGVSGKPLLLLSATVVLPGTSN